MNLARSKDLQDFTKSDLILEVTELRAEIKKLRGQLGVAERIAFFDRLTDLPNRYGYDRYVAALQSLAQTMDFRISLDQGAGGGILVAQVDIDHFKAVNTMLTHFGADIVLKEFGARLAKCTRANAIRGDKPAGVAQRCLASLIVEEYLVRAGHTGSDLISRWGGEEFFCIFPLCYRDSAAALAAYDDADQIIMRMMDTIRRQPFVLPVNDATYETIKHKVIGNTDHYYNTVQLIEKNGKRVALPLSASIGYTVISWDDFISHSKDDAAHLFRNVVDLMRRAKETGRNRAITVRAKSHDNKAAIHVYEGKALHKIDTADIAGLE